MLRCVECSSGMGLHGVSPGVSEGKASDASRLRDYGVTSTWFDSCAGRVQSARIRRRRGASFGLDLGTCEEISRSVVSLF